ncbi:unnamed protein product [Lasius platythorax]|uniref:Uncharacterized protein n=1 Tax=Lasius platythorax TaxID=488582 RepID=A0AAV2P5V5_9HYME
MAITGGRIVELLNALYIRVRVRYRKMPFSPTRLGIVRRSLYESADKATSVYKQGNRGAPERADRATQIGRNASGDRVNVDDDRDDGWFVYKGVDGSPGRSDDEGDEEIVRIARMPCVPAAHS